MTVLRLLTYNVRSLRDDDRAVAAVIRDADPHVVCIQEAPRFLRWRSKCAELARHSSLVVVSGGRPAAANLLLSSLAVDVVATRDVLLSPVPRRHQRGVALARLRLGGVEFAIAGTHLDIDEAPRREHAAELTRILQAWVPDAIPAIIAGDTNDDPGSAVWQALTAGRVDAWAAAQASDTVPATDSAHPSDSAPALDSAPVPAGAESDRGTASPGGAGDGATSGPQDNPRRRIDAVFVPPTLRVRSATVFDSPLVDRASDHRPLLVEVELGSPGPSLA